MQPLPLRLLSKPQSSGCTDIGGAIAESINGWIMFFTTMLLIKWKGYHKKCWHGWSSESLKEWGPIIKLGSAGALQSFGQMCSFEVTAAMSR